MHDTEYTSGRRCFTDVYFLRGTSDVAHNMFLHVGGEMACVS